MAEHDEWVRAERDEMARQVVKAIDEGSITREHLHLMVKKALANMGAGEGDG